MNAAIINSHSIMTMDVVIASNDTPVARVYIQGEGNILETCDFSLTDAFGIHACNEFLRSLKLNINIQFQSYLQYAQLIRQCVNQLVWGGVANA